MKWNKEGEMLPSEEVRCVVADDHGWEKLYVGQQAGKVYITKCTSVMLRTSWTGLKS